MDTLSQTYGKWAVVTGASSGIGKEFAIQLSQLGFSVVLVARRVSKLEAVSEEIQTNCPDVSTKVVPADLSSSDAAGTIMTETADLDVGLLINNAGVELHGNFLSIPEEEHLNMISLNIVGVTTLTHRFGRRFMNRNRSENKKSAMIVTSTMGVSPFPYLSSYAAAKAFVTTLSLGVRTEWANDGIDLMVLEPGLTATEMNARFANSIDFSAMGTAMPVQELVSEGLKAFSLGKPRFTPGTKNRVAKNMMPFIPESVRLPMMAKMMTDGAEPGHFDYKGDN